MSIMDLTSKAREYKELQTMIKQLEDEAEVIKQSLIVELEARNADTVQADIFTVKYAAYTSSRIDTTSFKKELPELAAIRSFNSSDDEATSKRRVSRRIDNWVHRAVGSFEVSQTLASRRRYLFELIKFSAISLARGSEVCRCLVKLIG